jgi:hypothetical protein
MLSSCLYSIANQNGGMGSMRNISLSTLLANAMPAVSNTVSINVVRYFNVDLMVIPCILGLLLGISSSYGSRFRFGGRIEQSQIKTHAPVRTVTRTVSIIFPADLKADRLFSNLQDLADLEDERHGPLRVARIVVPVGRGLCT